MTDPDEKTGAPLPTRDVMKAAVDGYLEAALHDDPAAIVGLYGNDARIEDPIDAEPRIGSDAIRAFYSYPRDPVEIERLGPITIFDRWAAFQFRVTLGERRRDGMPPGVVLTEMMRFDEDGKIAEMVAIPDVPGADEPLDGRVLDRTHSRGPVRPASAATNRDLMKAAVDDLLEAMLHDDVDRVMERYSPQATVEDPIGRTPMEGAEAIRNFFAVPRAATRIERFGPITIFEQWAAFQFRVDLGDSRPEGMPAAVLATQILRFDDGGLIDRMIEIPDVLSVTEPVDGKVFSRSAPAAGNRG